MAAETMHLRLPDQIREKLEQLAAATNRPRTYHVTVALERYLQEEIWQIAHIQQGLADLDAGRATSHEDVMAKGRHIIAEARTRSTHDA
ncbi:MAG TPA: CopG family transcriptional regulator [Chloroflexota bacterium]|nr:CopG family transcriptional regulator [Chloroflexota bacterium]